MKEKKRKLNQNKKKLSERRNPHSLKTKNQKPKKPQQQLILLMNFYSLQILFFRQTKYNTETRNSENNSNNNKKQKKREKTKRSKEFKIELKKKKKKEGEKEISDLRCRLVAIKRRCLANILGCNRVIPRLSNLEYHTILLSRSNLSHRLSKPATACLATRFPLPS